MAITKSLNEVVRTFQAVTEIVTKSQKDLKSIVVIANRNENLNKVVKGAFEVIDKEVNEPTRKKDAVIKSLYEKQVQEINLVSKQAGGLFSELISGYRGVSIPQSDFREQQLVLLSVHAQTQVKLAISELSKFKKEEVQEPAKPSVKHASKIKAKAVAKTQKKADSQSVNGEEKLIECLGSLVHEYRLYKETKGIKGNYGFSGEKPYIAPNEIVAASKKWIAGPDSEDTKAVLIELLNNNAVDFMGRIKKLLPLRENAPKLMEGYDLLTLEKYNELKELVEAYKRSEENQEKQTSSSSVNSKKNKKSSNDGASAAGPADSESASRVKRKKGASDVIAFKHKNDGASAAGPADAASSDVQEDNNANLIAILLSELFVNSDADSIENDIVAQKDAIVGIFKDQFNPKKTSVDEIEKLAVSFVNALVKLCSDLGIQDANDLMVGAAGILPKEDEDSGDDLLSLMLKGTKANIGKVQNQLLGLKDDDECEIEIID